jgi:hypothetical protein
MVVGSGVSVGDCCLLLVSECRLSSAALLIVGCRCLWLCLVLVVGCRLLIVVVDCRLVLPLSVPSFESTHPKVISNFAKCYIQYIVSSFREKLELFSFSSKKNVNPFKGAQV